MPMLGRPARVRFAPVLLVLLTVAFAPRVPEGTARAADAAPAERLSAHLRRRFHATAAELERLLPYARRPRPLVRLGSLALLHWPGWAGRADRARRLTVEAVRYLVSQGVEPTPALGDLLVGALRILKDPAEQRRFIRLMMPAWSRAFSSPIESPIVARHVPELLRSYRRAVAEPTPGREYAPHLLLLALAGPWGLRDDGRFQQLRGFLDRLPREAEFPTEPDWRKAVLDAWDRLGPATLVTPEELERARRTLADADALCALGFAGDDSDLELVAAFARRVFDRPALWRRFANARVVATRRDDDGNTWAMAISSLWANHLALLPTPDGEEIVTPIRTDRDHTWDYSFSISDGVATIGLRRRAESAARWIPGEHVLPLGSLTADTDGDGLRDEEEALLGLDPRKPDTDGDKIPDGRDLLPTTPASPDSDEYEGAQAVWSTLIGTARDTWIPALTDPDAIRQEIRGDRAVVDLDVRFGPPSERGLRLYLARRNGRWCVVDAHPLRVRICVLPIR